MASFFINAPFTVSQNTAIYAQNVAIETGNLYDYIITLNFRADGNTSMNDLFNKRTYIQGMWDANNNSVNNLRLNNVSINLETNTTLLNSLFSFRNSSFISSLNTNVSSYIAYSTLDANGTLLPYRFLEILATKIFGHAKAHAAIYNDSEFYIHNSVSNSILKQITDGINNTLQDTNMQLNIFNIYSGLDRIEQQGLNNLNTIIDVNQQANFNFKNTIWDFPIFFESSLIDISNSNNLELLNNGPDVGGNILTNGSVNIPILIRFSSDI